MDIRYDNYFFNSNSAIVMLGEVEAWYEEDYPSTTLGMTI